MAWPSGAVDTTDTDAGTDNPQSARADILDAMQKLNQIIALVSTYIQGLLDDVDAAAARTTLGLGALAVKTTVATADIDNDAVTYAKIQNISATDKLLGRSTAGAGDTEEIACTAAARSILDDTTVAAILATLGGAPLASPTFTGTPLETMGTGSGTAALIGKAFVDAAIVSSVGSSNTVLKTFDVPGNSLSANGKGVRVTFMGSTANNASAKSFTVAVGSSAILSGNFTVSIQGIWRVMLEIIRTGSNAQRIHAILTESSPTLTSTFKSMAAAPGGSESDTAAITVKVSATGVSNGDIVGNLMLVEYIG